MPTSSPRRHLGSSIALTSLVGALAVTLPPTMAQAADAQTSITAIEVPATSTGTADGKAVIASLPTTSGNFDLVGLTWKTLPDGAVPQVRTLGGTGWSDWTTLEINVGASETGRGRLGTDPTYVGASTQVEARVLGSTGQQADDLRLSLVDTNKVTADESLPSSAGTSYGSAASGYTYATKPTVISRSQWGADESLLSYNGSGCVPANLDSTISAAIVHHTAGSNSYTKDQSASIVRGIYAYHVKTMGWCDIGYNFLVDKYGQVFEGRHGGVYNPVHGAHATSWNTNTVGVSVMMNSATAAQTDAAMSSVTKVLAWKLAGNYRDPAAKLTLAGKYINRIARHGDVMSTACPGTNITAYMPTLRTRVASAMGNWQTPIYQAWVAQGGEGGVFGSPHVMERGIAGGRVTDFAGGDIYQKSSTNATFALTGSVAARYESLGRTTSWLGWPTGSQEPGASTGLSVARFANGRIYHSSATGAHAVTTAMAAWMDANPSAGYPTAEAVNTSSTAGYQNFSTGRVSWQGGSYKRTLTPTPNPTPTATATPTVTPTKTATPARVVMGDQTGDKRADLISVQPDGSLRWFPTGSTAKSGAARTGTSLTGKYSWVSQVPDLDGDGKGELLARDIHGRLYLWRGLGSGKFTAKKLVGTGWNGLRELAVAPDMDGDAMPEVLGINAKFQLVRYTLSKDLRISRITVVGGDFTGMRRLSSVGDVNGDGFVDVLVVDSSSKLWRFSGSAGGGLAGTRVLAGWGWGAFTRVRGVGDLNGDGRWDLVAHGSTTTVRVYLNTTSGLKRGTDLMASTKGLGLTA